VRFPARLELRLGYCLCLREAGSTRRRSSRYCFHAVHGLGAEVGQLAHRPVGLVTGGLDSLESSPYVTLSRGAFSASLLVTLIP
jgi:hypothetical protein